MANFNNKRLLIVSKDFSDKSKGGREQLSRINQRILQEIFQDNLYLFDTSPKKITSCIKKFLAVRGFIDGLSLNKCHQILRKIEKKNIKQVYIDGSNFGKLAQFLKKNNPHIKIISFFHNVEAKFFFDAFMKKKSFRSFIIMVANYIAERLAVKYSDTIISLSERDSNFLLNMYGRAACEISPLIINRPQKESLKSNIPTGDFFIFVGGAFYANIHGIRWFINNVMPEINEDLYIIGKGFEKYKKEFEKLSNVHVMGYVEFLSHWYEAAKFVVAPIFEGSGMKTKVAESLMFGKILIGTPESFSGYEAVKSIAGIECSCREEFIQAIKNKSFNGSDHERRRAYEELYSFQAGKIRMENILSE